MSGSGPFTITPSGSFFNVSETADTAPAIFTVSVTNTVCSNGKVTCYGSITLHPTSASGGGSDVSLVVSFTPGSGGGGNGVIAANPGSVTFTSFSNTSSSAVVSLTTNSVSALGFSFTITPQNSWLSVSASNSQVSVNGTNPGPATITVFANAIGITSSQQGSVTITPNGGGAQLVIPVTLNIFGSSASTYTVNPTSVQLAYPSGTQSQGVFVGSNNAGVTTFNAQVSNCNGANFLLVSGGFGTGTQLFNQPVANGLNLFLNSPQLIQTGVYTCQVVISNPTNLADQVVIPVSLTVNGGALSASGASPNAGTGSLQTFNFTFADSNGYQDLDIVNVLINYFLDGRQACYLAYSRPQNVLYLVSDDGSGLQPGLLLNGTGSVSNSQCSIFGAGSSAAGSGNSLQLTLNVGFLASFAGNKTIYMAARNSTQNTGWQALGTWNVPGGTPGSLGVGGVNPAHGAGLNQQIAFTFTDTRGYPDLGVVNILINSALDGRQSCYLAYSRPLNVLYLVNDAGSGLLPGVTLGTGSVGNSQCTVNSGFLSVNGNSLTLTLNMSFAGTFSGNRIVYMAARDVTDTVNSNWQPVGTWTVQ